MIGDRAVDISSAKANGLRSVGVLWGFGDLAELQGAGADVILRGTNELGQLGI
jgi:phosphoglycolate phosphatase